MAFANAGQAVTSKQRKNFRQNRLALPHRDDVMTLNFVSLVTDFKTKWQAPQAFFQKNPFFWPVGLQIQKPPPTLTSRSYREPLNAEAHNIFR